jgi:hypothetical protein
MDKNRKIILDLLLNKSALKQNIADDCEKIFTQFKASISKEIDALKEHINDPRIRLSFKEKGSFEIHVFVGSDVLVFHLHNNVFRLPDDNPLWGTRYFQADDTNGYFGVIYIYNFLAESFIQNRLNDSGYLIGRLFINHDRHFMMEGKGQLGYLFRDIENVVLSEELISLIVQSAFAFALEFDLLIPPYDFVSELSVGEIQVISNNLQLQTGKRLGFKMKSEDTEI